MRRILLSLLTLILFLPMTAQDYAKMWKGVDEASQKDLPKTALRLTREIARTAQQHQHTAQLIRATMTEAVMLREIAPDSALAMRESIEAHIASAAKPIERALWQHAYGLYLLKGGHSWSVDTADLRKAEQLLWASVADVELLARTSTRSYATLFETQGSSRDVYRNDLLSIFVRSILDQDFRRRRAADEDQARKRQLVERALAIYQKAGMRRAALQMDRERVLLLPKAERENLWPTLRKRYLDLSDNVANYLNEAEVLLERGDKAAAVALLREGTQRYKEAAIPLFNLLKRTENTYASLRFRHQAMEQTVMVPGEKYWLQLESRNTRNVEVRFERLVNVRADDKNLRKLQERHNAETILRSMQHQTELVVRPALSERPAYEVVNDSVEFVAPQAGVYVVQMLVDGQALDSRLAYIARTARLEFTSASIAHATKQLRFADLLTGQPQQTEGDAQFVTKPWSYGSERALAPMSTPRTTEVKVFTDRAIYRPGQTVQIGGLVYDRNGDEYRAHPRWRDTIVVEDEEGKELLRTAIETDELGVFAHEFQLPDYVRPGEFSIYRSREGGKSFVEGFRVEYYKRPTYQVKFDELPRNAQLGDRIRVTGSVRSYTDLPIAGAKVEWSMEGSPLWWWRSDEPDGGNPHEKGTLTTDDKGQFAFEVTLGKAATKPWPYRFRFKTRVLASNGETQETSAVLTTAGQAEPQPQRPPLLALKLSDDKQTARLDVSGAAYVWVDLVSTRAGIVESKVLEVKDRQSITYAWQSSYGDALTIVVAAVKNGQFFTESATVQRPEPNKQLKMVWTSFRSYLQPGQSEEWTLKVTDAAGRPVAANVMARLYDATLDAFARKSWAFDYIFARQTPNTNYGYALPDAVQLWGQKALRTANEPQLKFTRWLPSLFDYDTFEGFGSRLMLRSAKVGVVAESMDEMALAAPMALEAKQMNSEVVIVEANDASTPEITLRENFNETAFFYPRLRTNQQGEATLRFTLPESLTQWRFTAFAHDPALNTAVLEDTIVARKLLMAQLAAPRFLREGDRTRLPIEVRNVDEQPQRGRVVLSIIDSATQRELAQFKADFDLTAGQAQHWTFDWQAPEGTAAVVTRLVAQSKAYSDGEEREIPILSRRVAMVHAVPFTVKSGEKTDQKLAQARTKLMAQLEAGVQPTITEEASKDARQEVARLVPDLLKMADNGNPLDVAIAYYAHEIGASLRSYTNWSAAEIEGRRAQLLERLDAEQQDNGGWAWYRGMNASPNITSQIMLLLARAQLLTGSDAGEMQEQALAYLDVELQKEVQWMRRQKNPYVSDWEYRLLYIYKVLGRPETADVAFVQDLMAKERKSLTMYGKSAQAIILSGTRHDAESQLALESLVEHTVVSDEMGRSFDTDRAFGGWSSYRIPTQTFAIEALEQLKQPSAKVDGMAVQQLVDELRLWLLQSKRTQVWNTSVTTANAIHALLRVPQAEQQQLTWGAVTARYALPYDQAMQKGAGFAIERRLERWDGQQWTAATTDGAQISALRVGERVRWVYSLTADRDFDHVSLLSTRPACFETRYPLSGISWRDGLTMYAMVRDDSNEYFIEHLPKGRHTFTDEMVVDRVGHYSAGWAKVQSVFAPEFVGNSTAHEVEVLP